MIHQHPEDLIEHFPSRRRRSSTATTCSSCCSQSNSNDSLCIDPIFVASITGSSQEFRILQKELRKSKMVTAGGAKHLLKVCIEKQGISIESKRTLDPKLSKVKSWKLAKQRNERTLKRGLNQGLQNLRSILSVN
mmetsp:Transcript_1651/g.2256  ORF Transcript_1651/g.2256 Transcript_1651/m.2256 type:complete len:135 (-) Transcript_1651:34-438(-)